MDNMGSDDAKMEKKRLKAQVKAEKARAKSVQPVPLDSAKAISWYKDPNWIRAIIAIVALVVAIITLALTI